MHSILAASGIRGWTEKSDPGDTPRGVEPIRSLTSQTPRRSAAPQRASQPSNRSGGRREAASKPLKQTQGIRLVNAEQYVAADLNSTTDTIRWTMMRTASADESWLRAKIQETREANATSNRDDLWSARKENVGHRRCRREPEKCTGKVARTAQWQADFESAGRCLRRSRRRHRGR